jgi:hypothetical protein
MCNVLCAGYDVQRIVSWVLLCTAYSFLWTVLCTVSGAQKKEGRQRNGEYQQLDVTPHARGQPQAAMRNKSREEKRQEEMHENVACLVALKVTKKPENSRKCMKTLHAWLHLRLRKSQRIRDNDRQIDRWIDR